MRAIHSVTLVPAMAQDTKRLRRRQDKNMINRASWHRVSVALCFGMVLVFGSCTKKNATKIDETASAEAEKGIGRSPNWKVEVVSAKRDVKIHLSQTIGRLSVKLKIQYLGPSGVVKAPLTKVTYQSIENKEEDAPLRGFTADFSVKPEAVDFGKWVVESNVQTAATTEASSTASKQLENGKTFEITFDYDFLPYKPSAPSPSGKFWLQFADVPRIESSLAP